MNLDKESLTLSEDKGNYFEEKMISGFEKNQFEINQAGLNKSSVSLILHSSIPSQAATASSKKVEKCPIPPIEEIDLNVVVKKNPQKTRDIKARKVKCKFEYRLD